MSPDEMTKLKFGDIIRPHYSGENFMVLANLGGRIIAVKTIDIIIPAEWCVVHKSGLPKVDCGS